MALNFLWPIMDLGFDRSLSKQCVLCRKESEKNDASWSSSLTVTFHPFNQKAETCKEGQNAHGIYCFKEEFIQELGSKSTHCFVPRRDDKGS